jgi:tRNA dimethylallyltransferase
LSARVNGVELVSVDSMAVYRGLDIGTETPPRSTASWHLLNIADPAEDFSVAQFQDAARAVLAQIHSRGHRAILVGGTGLYHRAAVDGLELPGRYPEVARELEIEASSPEGLASLYESLAALDPLAASRIEPGNRRRIVRALEVTVGAGRRFSSFGPGLGHYPVTGPRLAGLSLERPEIDRRLAERLDAELAAGWLEEVARLASHPGGLSRTARQAIGYRELLAHLEDGLPLQAAKTEILRRLKAFARRQEAWFRRDPRVKWFQGGSECLADEVIEWWGVTADPPKPGASAPTTWETYSS